MIFTEHLPGKRIILSENDLVYSYHHGRKSRVCINNPKSSGAQHFSSGCIRAVSKYFSLKEKEPNNLKITVEFENGKIEELNPLKLRNRLLIENLLVEVPRKTNRCPALVFKSLFDKISTENVYVQYFGTKEVEKILTRQLYPFKQKEYKRDSLPLTVLEDLSVWLRENKMQLLLLNGPYTLSPCHLIVYSNDGISYNGTLTEHNLFERKLNVHHQGTLETISVDPKIAHVIIKCSDEQLDMMMLGNATRQHFSRHTNIIKEVSFNSNMICLNWNFPSWMESIIYQEQFAALTTRPSKFFGSKQSGLASSLDTVSKIIKKPILRLKKSIEIIGLMHEAIRLSKSIEISDVENFRSILNLSNLKLINQELKSSIQKNEFGHTQSGLNLSREFTAQKNNQMNVIGKELMMHNLDLRDLILSWVAIFDGIHIFLNSYNHKQRNDKIRNSNISENVDSETLINLASCDSKTLINQSSCDSETLINRASCNKETLMNRASCDSKTLMNQVSCDSETIMNQASHDTETLLIQAFCDIETLRNQASHNSKSLMNQASHGIETLINQTSHDSEINTLFVFKRNQVTTEFNKKSFCTIPVYHQTSSQATDVFNKSYPSQDQISNFFIDNSHSPLHLAFSGNFSSCPSHFAFSKIKTCIKSNHVKKLDKTKRKYFLSKMAIIFLKSFNKSIPSFRFFEDAKLSCKKTYFNFKPCCTELARLEKVSARQMRSSFQISRLKKNTCSNITFTATADVDKKFALNTLYSGDALYFGDSGIHYKKTMEETEIKECIFDNIFKEPAPKKMKLSTPFIETKYIFQNDNIFQTLQKESKTDTEVKNKNFLPSFFHNRSQIKKKCVDKACNQISVFEPKLQHSFENPVLLDHKANNKSLLQYCSGVTKNVYAKCCPQILSEPSSSTIPCQFLTNGLNSSLSLAKIDKWKLKFENTTSLGTVIQKYKNNFKEKSKGLLNFFDFNLFDADQMLRCMSAIEVTDNIDLYLSQSSLVSRNLTTENEFESGKVNNLSDIELTKNKTDSSTKTVPSRSDSNFIQITSSCSRSSGFEWRSFGFNSNKMPIKFLNNTSMCPYNIRNNAFPVFNNMFSEETLPVANISNPKKLTLASLHDTISTNQKFFVHNKKKCSRPYTLTSKPYQIPYRLCLDQSLSLLKPLKTVSDTLIPIVLEQSIYNTTDTESCEKNIDNSQTLSQPVLNETCLEWSASIPSKIVNNKLMLDLKQPNEDKTILESLTTDKPATNKLLSFLKQPVHNKTVLESSTIDISVNNKLMPVLHQPIHNETVLESATTNIPVNYKLMSVLQQPVYDATILESSTFDLPVFNKQITVLKQAVHNETVLESSTTDIPVINNLMSVLQPPVFDETVIESATTDIPIINKLMSDLQQPVQDEANLVSATSDIPIINKLMSFLQQAVFDETVLESSISDIPVINKLMSVLLQPVYNETTLESSTFDILVNNKPMSVSQQPVHHPTTLESETIDMPVINKLTSVLQQPVNDETILESSTTDIPIINKLMSDLQQPVQDEANLESLTTDKPVTNKLLSPLKQPVYNKTGLESATTNIPVNYKLMSVLQQPVYDATTLESSTFDLPVFNKQITVLKQAVHDETVLESSTTDIPAFNKQISILQPAVHSKTVLESSTADIPVFNKQITVLKQEVHDETVLESLTTDIPAFNKQISILKQIVYDETVFESSTTDIPGSNKLMSVSQQPVHDETVSESSTTDIPAFKQISVLPQAVYDEAVLESSTIDIPVKNKLLSVLQQPIFDETTLGNSTTDIHIINKLMPVFQQPVYDTTTLASSTFDLPVFNKQITVLKQVVDDDENVSESSTTDIPVANKVTSVLQQPVHDEATLESSTFDKPVNFNLVSKYLDRSIFGETALISSTIDKTENLVPTVFKQSVNNETELECSISKISVVNKLAPSVLEQSVYNATTIESSTFEKTINNLTLPLLQQSVHENTDLYSIKSIIDNIIPKEQFIISLPSTSEKPVINKLTHNVLQRTGYDNTVLTSSNQYISPFLHQSAYDGTYSVFTNSAKIVSMGLIPENLQQSVKPCPPVLQKTVYNENFSMCSHQPLINKQTLLNSNCQKSNLFLSNCKFKQNNIQSKVYKFDSKNGIMLSNQKVSHQKASNQKVFLSSSKKTKSMCSTSSMTCQYADVSRPIFTVHQVLTNNLDTCSKISDIQGSAQFTTNTVKKPCVVYGKNTHSIMCGKNVQPIINSGKRKFNDNTNEIASKVIKPISTYETSKIELKNSTSTGSEICIALSSESNIKTIMLQFEAKALSSPNNSLMTNQKLYDKPNILDAVLKQKKRKMKRSLEKDDYDNNDCNYNAKKIITSEESVRRSQRSAANNTNMRIRECQKNEQYNEEDNRLADANNFSLSNTVSEKPLFIYKILGNKSPPKSNLTAENQFSDHFLSFSKSQQPHINITYQKNDLSQLNTQLKTMHEKVQICEQCTDVEKANDISHRLVVSSPHSAFLTTVTTDTHTSTSSVVECSDNNSSSCLMYSLPSTYLTDISKCSETNLSDISKCNETNLRDISKCSISNSPVKVLLTDCNKSLLKAQPFKASLGKNATDKTTDKITDMARKTNIMITNQKKNRFHFPKIEELKDSCLQVNSCSYYPDLPFCIDCQSDAGEAFCRFIMFRRLDSGKSNGFCTTDDAVDGDLLHWIFDHSKTNLDVNLCKQILEYVGAQFQELVQEEALAMNLGGKPASAAWKRAVLQVREMCDICATTMFNTHWTCDRCGFAVCLDCFSSTFNYENIKGKCNNKWPFCQYNGEYLYHNTKSLTVTQIIPRKVLFDLRDDLLRVCKQIGLKFYDLDLLEFSHSKNNLDPIKLNVPAKELLTNSKAIANSTETIQKDTGRDERFLFEDHNIFDKYKRIESFCNEYKSECRWFCNKRMLHVQTPRFSHTTMLLFQKQWKQGAPIVVSNVHNYLNKELWCPDAFSRDFGHEHNDVVNCLTGKIIENFSVRHFWRGFESVSERPVFDGTSALLKLKDWPSGDDFQDKLPERFYDLMKALPAPYYTHRNGQLNLAARLPNFFAVPDLGPKMYNAYGSASHASAGTTNLHLDISDATNVIVYVGIPKEEKYRQTEINDAFKIIDSACCEATRSRIRDENVKPGALWHIFPAKSAEKIRMFLRRISVERGIKMSAYSDPIHDQAFYLDKPLLDRLKQEEGVVGFAICQCLGDAVFIPAGAPHQVLNLHSCIKVAEDFVGPEHMSHCIQLTQEFRHLSDYHTNHEDKLQIKNILFHTVKDCLGILKKSYNL